MFELPTNVELPLVSASLFSTGVPELANVKFTNIAHTISVNIIATDDNTTFLFLNTISFLLNPMYAF